MIIKRMLFLASMNLYSQRKNTFHHIALYSAGFFFLVLCTIFYDLIRASFHALTSQSVQISVEEMIQVTSIQEQLKVILIFCLLLAFAGMIAMILICIQQSLDERTKEIAIYKAVGFDSLQIVTVLWIETLFMLLAGFLTGAVTAILLHHLVLQPIAVTLMTAQNLPFPRLSAVLSLRFLPALLVFLSLLPLFPLKYQIDKKDVVHLLHLT